MSGITNPAEEYFKDGLWAWTGAVWKKLIVDVSSFLKINIAAQDIGVEVIQGNSELLAPGVRGWDGALWRKLPLLWGYSERWVQLVFGAAAGAGDAVASTTAVAPGFVYVLQSASVLHTAAAAKEVYVNLITTGDAGIIFHDLTTDQDVSNVILGEFVLSAGDIVRATAVAPGAGEIVYLRVWGYKMKIAE